MAEIDAPYPKFSAVGDSALLIEFSNEINEQVNDIVYKTDSQMLASPLNGVVEWVPGYASILIHYDPMVTTYPVVQKWLLDCLTHDDNDREVCSKRVEIIVHYGGKDGPDLDHVAELHEMSPLEVIRKHTERIYRVGMMGFTPGFTYLMGLNPDISTPRLASPRTHVPRGSVGIAGSQTGIYPLDSPGGWQIIGRTEQTLFDPDNEPYFLLSPGDEVQFIAAEGWSHE